jgi:ferredoxin
MPATAERYRANACGRYYVTEGCNGCGLCSYVAPANFSPSFDGAYYGVAAQPATPAEVADMDAALYACPQNCIHDDGDE